MENMMVVYIPEKIKNCIDQERLEYLFLINRKDIYSSNLLSLPHQTILRIFISINNFTDQNIGQLIRAYCYNPDYRQHCLDTLLKKIVFNIKHAGELKENTGEKMKYSGTSSYHRLKFKTLCVNNSRKTIYFENQHGFGIFPVRNIITIEGRLSLMTLEECRLASVGAMMFYGFNSKQYSNLFFLQKIPIKILAYTLYYMSCNKKNNVDIDWWEHMYYHELASVVHSFKPEDFEKGCLDFLIAHELGHTYRYNNNQKILSFLYEIGLDKEDIYQPDFPSQYDLDAWHRIKSGLGTCRDVCFILGDLLANLVILAGGISPLVHSLLRSFNWSLIMPPSAERRPRGNILFLRYSLEDSLDPILNILRKIFLSVKLGGKTAELMQQMEKTAWEELENIYESHSMENKLAC